MVYISITRNFVNEEPENWYPYYILACQMRYYKERRIRILFATRLYKRKKNI